MASMRRISCLFGAALVAGTPAIASDCDARWKELRASLLAFRELQFLGTVPAMPTGAIEMTVVEKAVDRGPDALDVETQTALKGFPVKVKGLGDHTSRFTREKFCAETARPDGAITMDGQSPGALLAQVFRSDGGKPERVKTPAGSFDARYFESKVRTKHDGKEGLVKIWVAKLHGHRMPVRTLVQYEGIPMTFDVQLTRAVLR
jgi:hypothetical protein